MLALCEAIITLIITQIPFWLAIALYALGAAEATFLSSLYAILDTLSPGDALVYSAGILASSTAYAIMKIRSFRAKPVLMLILILLPILTILSAMPLYIQDANDKIENIEFAQLYVRIVLIVSALLWIHALYQARAFFEVQLSHNKKSDDIVKNIQG